MEVIGASAEGAYAGELAAWGIRHEPVTHATRSNSVGQDVQALAELVRMFRRLRPDIVHTHNPKPGVYGRLAAKLAGVPVVVNTVHGLYATPTDSLLRRALVYGLERTVSICSQAELVQNVEDMEALARWRVPARKLVLLGNGIDLRAFSTPALRGRGGGPPVDGCGGRARARRGGGPPGLGEGVRRTLRGGPPPAAQLPRRRHRGDRAGRPGQEQRVVRRRRAAGRGDRQRAIPGGTQGRRGSLSGDGPLRLPSYREGFPRSAMEAAACGVPVVATDIRGCRQVVDHGTTGLLVSVRDGAALAGAIEDPGR